MSDVFRTIKTTLAYAQFENPDIAGAFYKLIDSLESDIVANYEPSEKTEEAIGEIDDAIEDYNSSDEDEIVDEEDEDYDSSEDEDEDEDDDIDYDIVEEVKPE